MATLQELITELSSMPTAAGSPNHNLLHSRANNLLVQIVTELAKTIAKEKLPAELVYKGAGGTIDENLLPAAEFLEDDFIGTGVAGDKYRINPNSTTLKNILASGGGNTNPSPSSPSPTTSDEMAVKYTAITPGVTTDSDGTINNNNTANPSGALVIGKLGNNGSYIQYKVAENYFGSQTAFISFTNNITDYNYYGMNSSFGTENYQAKYGSNLMGAFADVLENSIVRLVRINTDDVLVRVSKDNGSTFKDVGTAVGVLANLGNPNIVIKFSNPSADRILREVRAFGLV